MPQTLPYENASRKRIATALELMRPILLNALSDIRRREDREDCFQNVCLQLLTSLNLFDPSRGSLSTFCHTLARNEVVRFLKWTSRNVRSQAKRQPLENVQVAATPDNSDAIERAAAEIQSNPGRFFNAEQLAVWETIERGMMEDEAVVFLNITRTEFLLRIRGMRNVIRQLDIESF